MTRLVHSGMVLKIESCRGKNEEIAGMQLGINTIDATNIPACMTIQDIQEVIRQNVHL